MAELNSYRTLTPYLVVPDAEGEARFLQAVLGAEEVSCDRNAAGRIIHAEFRVGDSLVMLAEAGEACPALGAALYVWVPDVDAVYARALAAGARSTFAPEDKPYGHRNAGVEDGNGITWWMGSPCA
jgi:PhnB protein